MLHKVKLMACFTPRGEWEGAQIIKGAASKLHWLGVKFCRIGHVTSIQYFV